MLETGGKNNWEWEFEIPRFGRLKLPRENVVLYLSKIPRKTEKRVGEKEGIISCWLGPITQPCSGILEPNHR